MELNINVIKDKVVVVFDIGTTTACVGPGQVFTAPKAAFLSPSPCGQGE